MDSGLDRTMAEVENDFADRSCPLVLGLITCIQEAGPMSPAVPHLRQALMHLGVTQSVHLVEGGVRCGSKGAIAAYLEFLLPELQLQSPGAALSTRWAAYALRGVGSNGTGRRAQ